MKSVGKQKEDIKIWWKLNLMCVWKSRKESIVKFIEYYHNLHLFIGWKNFLYVD